MGERFQENYEVWNWPWIQVGQCGDWTFALERGITHEGSRPERVRRVSLGTVAVSIDHNCNHSSASFHYAVNGVLLAQVYSGGWVGDPTLVQELFRQAKVDPESEGYDYMEAMFALAEGIGICFDREVLMGQMLSGEIFPLP